MEQLANLPTPALITFGFTLAVIFGVRYLGLWQGGKSAPTASPAAAQVAAVIVDPTALNRATAALEAHTAELKKLTEACLQGARQVEILAIEVDRTREEMRILREIRRRD